jgi:hypothetical protein
MPSSLFSQNLLVPSSQAMLRLPFPCIAGTIGMRSCADLLQALQHERLRLMRPFLRAMAGTNTTRQNNKNEVMLLTNQ